MENICILVVDDDKEIVESICIFLKSEGYSTLKAYNGLDALEMVCENKVHLVLLDIMMPCLDGIEALMKLRETNNIPVILISAKSEDNDKILGLCAGADDYITKPFNPSEMLARVKSQLRRYMYLGGAPEKASAIKVGGLAIDTDSKSVSVDGEAVKLTPMEYKILELLCSNVGKVFSTEEIYKRVWNENIIVGDNTVAVHIRHIREKIEINPKEPRYLRVVWGIGYKIKDNGGGAQ